MLVVGGRPYTAQLLRQILAMLGVRRVLFALEMPTALDMLRTTVFSVVFCHDHIHGGDPDRFAAAARRTRGLANPMVPIFLVCSQPVQRDVEDARDAGFHDVLARPISAATVLRKLKTVLLHPRPFISSGEFLGPDRRVAGRPFAGMERRSRQPRRIKVGMPVEGDATEI